MRRSVEAIQEYNAGRELSEQYGISSTILRQLTGTKPDKVKEWMEAHKAELDSYSSAQGHGYHQNKGKLKPKYPSIVRAVIKWSEQDYGAYEW